MREISKHFDFVNVSTAMRRLDGNLPAKARRAQPPAEAHERPAGGAGSMLDGDTHGLVMPGGTFDRGETVTSDQTSFMTLEQTASDIAQLSTDEPR